VNSSSSLTGSPKQSGGGSWGLFYRLSEAENCDYPDY
jgi:hypothetical protein